MATSRRCLVELSISEDLFGRLKRIAAAEDSPEAAMRAGDLSEDDLRRVLPLLPDEERKLASTFLQGRPAARARVNAARRPRGRWQPTARGELIISKSRTKAAAVDSFCTRGNRI